MLVAIVRGNVSQRQFDLKKAAGGKLNLEIVDKYDAHVTHVVIDNQGLYMDDLTKFCSPLQGPPYPFHVLSIDW